MVQLLFVLGTDFRFSLCELAFVLRQEFPASKILATSRTCALVEFPHQGLNQVPIESLQQRLGGIQKVVHKKASLPLSVFQGAFPETRGDAPASQWSIHRSAVSAFVKENLQKIYGPIGKARYFAAHSVYPARFDDPFYKRGIKFAIPFLNKVIEEHLLAAGARKVNTYRYPKENLERGDLNPLFPHHVLRYRLLEVTRAEIVWSILGDQVVLGRTFAATDPNYYRTIDEDRPYREFQKSMPPKLAKGMLNLALSGIPARPRPLVYDPFCGTGTILLIAFHLEYPVCGSDINPECVSGTRENLTWLSRQEVRRENSWEEQIWTMDVGHPTPETSKVHPMAIVTEPFLLPYFTENPSGDELNHLFAKDVLPGYQGLFQLAEKTLPDQGRLCCSVPLVKGNSFEIGGFRAICKDIPDSLQVVPCCPENETLVTQGPKYVTREIILLEKRGKHD